MKDTDVVLEERIVMVTDVHNFSIAVMSLAEPHRFLQVMYQSLGERVVESGGEIIKYVGDGMLCIFPAGLEAKAIQCGLKLRETFETLAQAHNLPSDTELEIGLSLGEVAVGTFGHPSLRQKDLFGPAVLQATVIGHHRGVAITEPVYRRLQDGYPTRRLPDRQVKWQDEALKIWEVIA